MDIAYICTNYNNSAFTVAAVRSLRKSQGHRVKIVVVDNASRSAEVDILRRLAADDPDVELIANEENVGYFRGLNIGIRASRARHPDINWMVVGNNDLEFPADFCDRLEREAGSFRAHSVISPDVITLDGEHQNPHVIEKISSVREIFYDLYYANYHLGRLIYGLAKMFPRVSERSDEEQWQTAQHIYQGHGSCYVLGPRFFAQFQELWAPTFMMAEEFFLSKQLSDVGEQVWYDPRLRVVHHWHGSLERLPNRKRWEMAREAHREYRKHVKVFARG